MHTDKEIIELIKEAYPLKPCEEFVVSTEGKLKHKARGINKSAVVKRASFAFSGLVLCIFALSWFFGFNGKETVSNTIHSFKEGNIPILIVEEETSVFIYQTHNLESFIPEINTKESREVFDDIKNISLVGERFSQNLKERNIGTIHDESDISGILKERGLSSGESFIVSREVLKNILENNKNINMSFDIHRDSAERKVTTLNLKGTNYARIAFIVSDSSANFKGNQKFAELLHKKMEEKYPGLSRGIIVKTTGNTYNLDILEKSVLLEIGGIDNNLEEEYRTVEALAEVIKEVIDLEMKK